MRSCARLLHLRARLREISYLTDKAHSATAFLRNEDERIQAIAELDAIQSFESNRTKAGEALILLQRALADRQRGCGMRHINWDLPIAVLATFVLWVAICMAAPKLWQFALWLWRAL